MIKLSPDYNPKRGSLILTKHSQEFVDRWPMHLYFEALKKYESLYPNNKIISHIEYR